MEKFDCTKQAFGGFWMLLTDWLTDMENQEYDEDPQKMVQKMELDEMEKSASSTNLHF